MTIFLLYIKSGVSSNDKLEFLPGTSDLVSNSDCHTLDQLNAESAVPRTSLFRHPVMGLLPRKSWKRFLFFKIQTQQAL